MTDESGFELALHSALSLAVSQPDPCVVHLFCYRFVPDLDTALPDGPGSLTLIVEAIGDDALEQHQTFGHVTKPALLKLLAIERLVGTYDRIAYLDNDILVFGDLRIGSIAFGSSPIAAVLDIDLSETGWLRAWAPAEQHREIASAGSYFNSGFMVFESRNWHRDDFYGKYVAALDRHVDRCDYKLKCTSLDQCALNRAFEGCWVNLPLSYNMQAGGKFTTSWRSSVVRHYCGRRKFIPVSPFRSDSRDVRHLNEIRHRLGHRRMRLPLLYEALFRLNALRNYPRGSDVRRFLAAARRRGL